MQLKYVQKYLKVLCKIITLDRENMKDQVLESLISTVLV